MGVPVVIATNGFGLPVRSVESGAPVLQVAENGRGFPIVLSDRGVPFVVIGSGPEPEGGPLRLPTPSLARGIVLAGHSSLAPSNYGDVLADAVGPVVNDFGQSSEDVWNNNGPARTGDYDMLIASETDSTPPAFYDGLADPASEQGLTNLQHLYWLGLEAKDRDAEFVLFNSPSARSNPVDPTNRARMNYYRQWLEAHLDMMVWVIPGELYVQELRDRGLTDDDIFSDQVHLNAGAVSAGAAYQAVAFVTGALPDGIPPEHAVHAAAALASVERYWWSGVGGQDYEAGLDIEDPLPNPLPRPEGPPAYLAKWTAEGYDGPPLTGNQPSVSGDALTFDGTGLASTVFTTSGFYAVMAIRSAAFSSVQPLLFFNPDPSDLFSDPYGGLRVDANVIAERWPEGFEVTISPFPDNEWTVVEGWVSGTRVGGWSGSADVENTSAETNQPETGGMSLFATGQPVEAVYLEIRSAIPDETTRAALRAAAEALIPE